MAREPFVAKYVNLWFGAFFYWMFSGFKGEYSTHLSPEKERRNTWTGYGLTVLFTIIIVWFVFK